MLSNLLAQADITSTIMIILLLVAIVGLFIWSSISNKKRQKQAQEMVDGIKIGDKVKTIGGVCGYVAEIDNAENTFVLRTGMAGKESFVKFDKGAIYQTAPAKPNEEKKEVAEEKSEPKAKKSTKKVVKEEVAEEAPAQPAEETVEEKPAE